MEFVLQKGAALRWRDILLKEGMLHTPINSTVQCQLGLSVL